MRKPSKVKHIKSSKKKRQSETKDWKKMSIKIEKNKKKKYINLCRLEVRRESKSDKPT